MNKHHDRRKAKALSEFRKMVCSGKDYMVEYMYSEVASKVYSTKRYVQSIVTQHYNSIITDEMVAFYKGLNIPQQEAKERISKEYGFCIVEARIIIRYMKYRINKSK